MSDYEKDLSRFLDDDWDRIQRDLQEHEQVERLAKRQNMTVDALQTVLASIDKGLRSLHAKYRPTQAELVDFALKHGKAR